MKKDIQDYVVPAFFLLLPFGIISYGLIWKSQGLFFIFMLLPIIALSIRNIWVRIFLLYVAAWQLFLFLMVFVNNQFNPGPGLTVTIALTAGAYLYKRVYEGTMPTEKWFTVIRWAVIVQLAFAIGQYMGFNPIVLILQKVTNVRELTPGQFVGTIGNRNFLMSFIAMSIPMFVGWRTFRLYPFNITLNLALIVILVSMVLSPSPAVIAGFIGITFCFKNTKRSIAVGLLAAGGYFYYHVGWKGAHWNEFEALSGQIDQLLDTGKILFPFKGGFYEARNLPPQHDLGRFAMWLVALSEMMKNWWSFIVGYGPGAFWGKPYNMHSEYVYTWFQFGFVGLAMMLGYIGTTIRFIRSNRTLLAAFIIICIDMGANYPMHIPTTAFMAIVIAGLIERERLKNG